MTDPTPIPISQLPRSGYDLDVWGGQDTAPVMIPTPDGPEPCPRKVDGACPDGCTLCRDFARELDSGAGSSDSSTATTADAATNVASMDSHFVLPRNSCSTRAARAGNCLIRGHAGNLNFSPSAPAWPVLNTPPARMSVNSDHEADPRQLNDDANISKAVLPQRSFGPRTRRNLGFHHTRPVFRYSNDYNGVGRSRTPAAGDYGFSQARSLAIRRPQASLPQRRPRQGTRTSRPRPYRKGI